MLYLITLSPLTSATASGNFGPALHNPSSPTLIGLDTAPVRVALAFQPSHHPAPLVHL